MDEQYTVTIASRRHRFEMANNIGNKRTTEHVNVTVKKSRPKYIQTHYKWLIANLLDWTMTRYQTAQTYASCLKGQAPMPTLPSYYNNELFVQHQTHPSLVRPACHLVLANRQTTQPPVADCQLVFIENTWDHTTAIKVTQSTQTDGEADSQKRKTPTPSTLDCEKQLFPPNDFPTRAPSRLTRNYSPTLLCTQWQCTLTGIGRKYGWNWFLFR